MELFRHLLLEDTNLLPPTLAILVMFLRDLHLESAKVMERGLIRSQNVSVSHSMISLVCSRVRVHTGEFGRQTIATWSISVCLVST